MVFDEKSTEKWFNYSQYTTIGILKQMRKG